MPDRTIVSMSKFGEEDELVPHGESSITGRRWRWRFGFKFEPRDLWVGVYWNRPLPHIPSSRRWLEVYVCPLPCVLFYAKRTDL